MQKTFTYQEAYELSLEYFGGDELAAQVYVGKYALTTPEGEVLEPTPEYMHRRLAKEFARIEQKYPNPMSEDEIFHLLDKFRYVVPQGSPMSGIGNPYQIQSISNCFIVESPSDSYGGILKTDQELIQISKRRGGVGLDISNIRPKGSVTANSSRTTDGIGVFMERYSNSIREVGQGGRRGAAMITISVHHPEIMTFINIKKDRKKVTGANISVRFTDEFMKAVRDDSEYEQRWPVDSDEPKVRNKIKAREVWNAFCESAWDCAEPGALFWDNVLSSPADCYSDAGYKTISTNPCCVAPDTIIMTKEGPRKISDLEGRPFVAIVNGKEYFAERGSWVSGETDVYKLETAEGYEITLTKEHEILTPSGWKQAQDLKEKDKIILSKHLEVNKWGGAGTWEEGYLLGLLVGDGTFNNPRPGSQARITTWKKDVGSDSIKELAFSCAQNMKYRSDWKGWRDNEVHSSMLLEAGLPQRFGIDWSKKTISNEVATASYDFQAAFLRGLFDTDGHIEGTQQKSFSIRLSSINLEMLKKVQVMLSHFGVRSRIYKQKDECSKLLPDGKGSQKTYDCQPCYRLTLSSECISRFAQHIGFTHAEKAKKLATILESIEFYNKDFVASVKSFTYVGKQEVWDAEVSEIHAFDANGILVHNSELPLCAYDSCRLALLNLYSYVSDPFGENATFNDELFREHVTKAQRLMDDLVDLEAEAVQRIIEKITRDPEPDNVKRPELELWLQIKEKTLGGRRTGLGVTGLGDMLAALGVRYGSEDSIKMVDDTYKLLCLSAYESSAILAGERGTFPVFDSEKEKNNEFIKRVCEESLQFSQKYSKFGRRNIACLTTAPAGSVSILTQTTSGIEPAYLLSYKRRRKINPGDKESRVDFVDELGDRWQEYTIYHHAYLQWLNKNLSTPSPYEGATSNDVDWKASVHLQATAQRWVDHGISKTCNLPNDASVDLVKEIYMKAWEAGCKGFTVYRDGCRDGVLVSGDAKPQTTDSKNAIKRPEFLECDIYHMTVDKEKWNIFVGLVDGSPYEVFAGLSQFVKIPKKVTKGRIEKLKNGNSGKYNLHFGDPDDEVVISDIGSVFENPTESAFTRTVSLALRHGVPIQFMVEQLTKGADKDSDMFSLSKALMRVLKNYIKDGTKISSKTCEQCRESNLIYQEGCVTCKSCGWSKCA